MRQTIWNLKSGGKEGQESYEEKRKAGLEYIEKLKKEDIVVEVVEEKDRFIITLK